MRGLFTKLSSVLIFSFILVLVAAVLALIFFGIRARSEGANFDAERDVQVELLASSEGLAAGGSAELAAVFTLPKNYHITSLESGFFFVEFDSVAGLTFGAPVFPHPNLWNEEEVFQGQVIVRSTVVAARDAALGERTLKAKVGYQVCSESGTFQCFFPVERDITLQLPILPVGTSPKAKNEAIWGSEIPLAPLNKGGGSDPGGLAGSSEGLLNRFEAALARGSFMALFLVFIGGILSSFTPCVYPIIPITISYIGARSTSRIGGLLLSLFFVLGLALMYSSLGIIAALTGGVFGGLTQNSIVYGIIIAIFIIMGISMMGAFDLQLPASWQGKLSPGMASPQSGQRKGLWGAVFMGMAAGLIAAPCVGPILVALLTWVAKTGSVLVGFGLLFSFSLGMGLLFIVIGTFAGAITTLPKAGQWMESIKHVFAWLLWGTAVYFAKFVLPALWMPLILGAFLLLLGIYVGAFRPFAEHQWRWIIGKWVGLLSVIAGLFFLLLGLSGIAGWPSGLGANQTSGSVAAATQPESPHWIVNDESSAFAQAAAANKPLMMDFYADWCAACVELDHRTYNQPEILSRAEKFVALKMDFTKQNDWSKQMSDKYQVRGMPTVIFFDAQGIEQERFAGYQDAATVSRIMDSILSISQK